MGHMCREFSFVSIADSPSPSLHRGNSAQSKIGLPRKSRWVRWAKSGPAVSQLQDWSSIAPWEYVTGKWPRYPCAESLDCEETSEATRYYATNILLVLVPRESKVGRSAGYTKGVYFAVSFNFPARHR